MEIPYTVKPRPDTGLTNPKLGIWLFIASEVMLFGGLFAGYIFMRLGAEPGYWPHGWLNVPVGTLNTFILILSSVTIILSWESLKMHKFKAFKNWLLVTWVCGLIFLGVKLGYEWPNKFSHFGAYVKKESAEKYDQYLGNLGPEGRIARGMEPRYFISGHITDHEASKAETAEAWHRLHDPAVKEIEVALLDRENAKPFDHDNDKAHFWPVDMEHMHHKPVLQKADLNPGYGAFVPRLNTYLATYFMITGLHGLHVLGGVIVFFYFWITADKWYKNHHQQLCNRIEVSGLFWHLVDLVWILVFPIFYLL